MTWSTLRTFNTRRFTVALQYTLDEGADSLDNYTEDNDASPYCFRVIVLCDGREVGAGYLGDSYYVNPADFAREHYGLAPKARAAGVTYCVYFPSMVAEACREARKTVAAMLAVRPVRDGVW